MLALSLTLPPAVAALPTVRSAVHSWAGERGVSPFPLALVAVELVANAVAVSPPGSSVELTVEETSAGIVVRVVDRGPGLDLRGREPPWASLPAPDQERGRGLYLVNQLARSFSVDRADGSTVVTAIVDPSSGSGGTQAATGSRTALSEAGEHRPMAGPSAGA